MGFNFRYHALLSYRKRMKEQAEIDLAAARRQLKEAVDLLETYRTRIRDHSVSFEARLKDGMTAGEIENHRDYLTGLRGRVFEQEREIQRREGHVRDRLAFLLKKTKQYKVIEKLKEKDFKKWQVHQSREEMKWMNEVAVNRHGKTFL